LIKERGRDVVYERVRDLVTF